MYRPGDWLFATFTSTDGRVALNGAATSAVGSTSVNEKVLPASLAAPAESCHALAIVSV
ncbi:hypothetical protein D3C83_157300 [compost metagenome]